MRMEFTMPKPHQVEVSRVCSRYGNALGFLSDSMVMAKDLMVQPNPPRFLREGDKIEFTVKVSNQSPTIQKGTVA